MQERGDNNIATFNIEDIFSSRGRVKIIRVLAKENELNISEIARQANLNHSTACQHLEFLKKAGIVQKKVFGRIKIFRFRLENIRAKAIKHLFDLWEETT
ncbi:MAG: winged helix-turn-helix domain-containing protein [Candidatus Ranarchaeia archaeon]